VTNKTKFFTVRLVRKDRMEKQWAEGGAPSLVGKVHLTANVDGPNTVQQPEKHPSRRCGQQFTTRAAVGLQASSVHISFIDTVSTAPIKPPPQQQQQPLPPTRSKATVSGLYTHATSKSG